MARRMQRDAPLYVTVIIDFRFIGERPGHFASYPPRIIGIAHDRFRRLYPAVGWRPLEAA